MREQFVLPKPIEWEAFEDIVCDLFSRKYKNNNFQRYGRKGQKQNGVDIVGLNAIDVIGIQCKHHTKGNILKKEIDEEVKESEQFSPRLTTYIIVTSDSRESKITSHVLNITEKRKRSGKYPVSIIFWEDIIEDLGNYPDLLIKHFGDYFPCKAIMEYSKPIEDKQRRSTIEWPFTQNQLIEKISNEFSDMGLVAPYNLSIGLTSFELDLSGRVDIYFPLDKIVRSQEEDEDEFIIIENELEKLKNIIDVRFISRTLRIYQNLRLSYAFLFGWKFRKVTKYDLEIIQDNQVWTTQDYPLVDSKVYELKPIFINPQSNIFIIILNISRDIDQSVKEFIEGQEIKPNAIISICLQGNYLRNPAHVSAVAKEISRRIKNVNDWWQASEIHLFYSMPAGLSTLVGYFLNAMCPITLYYRSENRDSYELGGTITSTM